MTRVEVALCYESVVPAKGGAETYLGDLARRLDRDGHGVRLVAARWDAATLPAATRFHRVTPAKGPRFLRPWRFAAACLDALETVPHDVSVGFDKTFGQDVLYPQGGLHAASREHNRRKAGSAAARTLARVGQWLDPAGRSFAALERRQYLGPDTPIIVANSEMVREHFAHYYGLGPERVRVVHSAIDPARFAAADRAVRRRAERESWGVPDGVPVGLFVAMNYRLKGLAPLVRAVAGLSAAPPFKIAVVGHPDYDSYQRLAVRLGAAERFLFLGFRAAPKDAYFGADFLVHPTFYDPCSLVALEALACGLPVVTSRHNGAKELLGGAGVVVQDPHDSGELGRAIAAVLDPAARAKMGAAALVAAAGWTFETHYAALVAVFAEAAACKRHAAGAAQP